MTGTEPIETKDTSLTRAAQSMVRHFSGNRSALLAVAVAAVAGGLAFNWNWLVAIGVAPILLSTLPCLVMCAFGVCMACRSSKTQSAESRGAADQTTRLTALGPTKTQPQSDGDRQAVTNRSAGFQQIEQLHSINERKDSHA